MTVFETLLPLLRVSATAHIKRGASNAQRLAEAVESQEVGG